MGETSCPPFFLALIFEMQWLVCRSNSPLSVVIIGVGNEDFELMVDPPLPDRSLSLTHTHAGSCLRACLQTRQGEFV